MFYSQDYNQVTFAIAFIKEKALNQWQQFKQKIKPDILMTPPGPSSKSCRKT